MAGKSINVTNVSALLSLNMNEASLKSVKEKVKHASHELKHHLSEIGEGAVESFKDLTASAGSLGGIIGSAFKGLSKGGVIGLGVGALAAALGAVAVQAEHMSSQFANIVPSITEIEAKAKGLGLTISQYQRLQYLSGISGVDVGSVERVITKLNLHAGEIQTKGAGYNNSTKFLSQVWGGDGSNLGSDEKLTAFMEGLKTLIDNGKRDIAIKYLNDIAPIASRDPKTQAFLTGIGLKNLDKANEFNGVISNKTAEELLSDENKEAYYGGVVNNYTREANRIAKRNDAFRTNYENIETIENNLKDELAKTAGITSGITTALIKTGEWLSNFETYLTSSNGYLADISANIKAQNNIMSRPVQNKDGTKGYIGHNFSVVNKLS